MQFHYRETKVLPLEAVSTFPTTPQEKSHSSLQPFLLLQSYGLWGTQFFD